MTRGHDLLATSKTPRDLEETLEKYSYLKSINAEYIEELLERYQKDPESLDASWRFFFEGFELGDLPTNGKNGQATQSNGASATSAYDLSSEAKVAELITAYRERGRLIANLDPLSAAPPSHPLLDLSNFGLSDKDLTRTFTAAFSRQSSWSEQRS